MNRLAAIDLILEQVEQRHRPFDVCPAILDLTGRVLFRHPDLYNYDLMEEFFKPDKLTYPTPRKIGVFRGKNIERILRLEVSPAFRDEIADDLAAGIIDWRDDMRRSNTDMCPLIPVIYTGTTVDPTDFSPIIGFETRYFPAPFRLSK